GGGGGGGGWEGGRGGGGGGGGEGSGGAAPALGTVLARDGRAAEIVATADLADLDLWSSSADHGASVTSPEVYPEADSGMRDCLWRLAMSSSQCEARGREDGPGGCLLQKHA